MSCEWYMCSICSLQFERHAVRNLCIIYAWIYAIYAQPLCCALPIPNKTSITHLNYYRSTQTPSSKRPSRVCTSDKQDRNRLQWTVRTAEKNHWFQPALHSGPIHVQSQETDRNHHCRLITPLKYTLYISSSLSNINPSHCTYIVTCIHAYTVYIYLLHVCKAICNIMCNRLFKIQINSLTCI